MTNSPATTMQLRTRVVVLYSSPQIIHSLLVINLDNYSSAFVFRECLCDAVRKQVRAELGTHYEQQQLLRFFSCLVMTAALVLVYWRS